MTTSLMWWEFQDEKDNIRENKLDKTPWKRKSLNRILRYMKAYEKELMEKEDS